MVIGQVLGSGSGIGLRIKGVEFRDEGLRVRVSVLGVGFRI